MENFWSLVRRTVRLPSGACRPKLRNKELKSCIVTTRSRMGYWFFLGAGAFKEKTSQNRYRFYGVGIVEISKLLADKCSSKALWI